MGKKVLAVDDSKTMRDMVSFTLKGAGYEVVEAADGLLALDALGSNQVDLVITDINMPNMDGIGLVKALRQNPAHSSTPILVLTTESTIAKKMKAERLAQQDGLSNLLSLKSSLKLFKKFAVKHLN